MLLTNQNLLCIIVKAMTETVAFVKTQRESAGGARRQRVTKCENHSRAVTRSKFLHFVCKRHRKPALKVNEDAKSFSQIRVVPRHFAPREQTKSSLGIFIFKQTARSQKRATPHQSPLATAFHRGEA